MTTRERAPKYFIQNTSACPACRRASVDVISTDAEPGLVFSRHFRSVHPMAHLTFCEMSLQPFERPAPKPSRGKR